jgi:transmembrane sensor
MTATDKRDDAIAWHIRLSDAGASGQVWEDFTAWLEADPANADAYDSVALADAALSDTFGKQLFASQNDNEVEPVRWYRRPATFAIAASVAALALVVPALMPGHDLQSYQTRPGEKRDIALSDGSSITLNGDTRIVIDRTHDRFARLESGEAAFTIRHDAANPFVVETANAQLQDIGTVFNVRQDGASLAVSVAEGAVRYNPKAEGLTINAGSQLTVAAADATPVITKTDPGSVAGWRHGRLSYQGAKLSAVAVDLGRSLGAPVKVSPSVADRRFTGVIRVDQDQTVFFHRLESLLGVRARHSGKGWQLTS